MELGAKLKQARLEAGLSQRQLCGDTITRNMLSQIENGSARPSMDTLRVLAERLQKPVSFFLGEEPAQSPKEKRLVASLQKLALARQVMTEGRDLYAAELLEGMDIAEDDYCAEDLNRRRLLLLGQVQPQCCRGICENLPSMDEELRIRARDALDRGDPSRSAALLDGAEDRESPQWNFLRGEVHLVREEYEQAAACYRRAEETWPEKTAARLERCFRELGDYKQAYFYACKQRGGGSL